MLESRRVVVLACALSAAACGGSLSTPDDTKRSSTETADHAPGATTTFFALVNADDSLCLPQALSHDASGVVTCRIVEALADAADRCSAHAGLVDAEPEIATAFRGTTDLVREQNRVCELAQLPQASPSESCTSSAAAGWCYVEGAAAGDQCPQALRFSARGQPAAGAIVAMACRR
jgi:hypothetical protein